MNIFPEGHVFEFGESNYEKGGRFGPLLKSYLALSLQIEGKSILTIDKISHALEEGQAALVFNENSAEYSFPQEHKTKIYWCETVSPFISKEDVKKIKQLPITLPITHQLERIMDLGLELGKGGGVSRNNFRNALGLALFNAYFDQANFDKENQKVPGIVTNALRYINSNYHKNFKINLIAKEFGVTPQYLSNVFKKYIGKTAAQYLWEVRIEKAGQLLCQTELSISEIAYQCGFVNQYHFSKKIKAYYNCSPSELREKEYVYPSFLREGNRAIIY